MKTVFVQVLDIALADKAANLKEAIRGGKKSRRYEVNCEAFRAFPRSSFAYWAEESILRIFRDNSRFSDGPRSGRVGLSTADNFRFLRLSTEVDISRIGSFWRPFAKGGRQAAFYADLWLLVAWPDSKNNALKAFGRAVVRNSDLFLREGLTWTLRARRFSPQALPALSVFSDRGFAAFFDEEELLVMLAIMNSSLFDRLFKIALGRFGFPEFIVGSLGVVPWPKNLDSVSELRQLAYKAWSQVRRLDTRTEGSHAFLLPGLLQTDEVTLSARTRGWEKSSLTISSEVESISSEIDGYVCRMYGLSEAERLSLTQISTEYGEGEGFHSEDDSDDAEEDQAIDAVEVGAAPMVASLLSWTLGVAFGRFDVRLATGAREAPPEPEPFDPLPVCSPGMLTGDDGLPVAAPPSGYPLTFPTDGILVDDPGHARDLVRAVRAVFEVVFDDANARWHEAAELLPTTDLRTWFAHNFFEPHIKRYSKSRRKAPIYWQLATTSGSYSVWLYIHRATPDTLFLVLNDFVEPKLDHEKAKLDSLIQEAGMTPSSEQRREIDQQETFVGELQALKIEVARVAPLWKPNLDDGVLLNFAPLWRLVPQNRGWQGECKNAWEKLQSGDYDWAHLAMHLWPERVVPRCMEDRSLAIAHGLEDVFWVEDEERWRPRNPPDQEEKLLIHRYQREGIQEFHSALSAVCQSHADVPASELWRMLEDKELDTTPLARLLWPRRIAERCFDDKVIAAAHKLSPPSREDPAKVRDKWLKEHEVSMWSHLKTHVGAALQATSGSAGQAWEALASGQLDEQPLALRLWAARVVSKARTDLSLAQRQGIERYFWCQEPEGGWRSCSSPHQEMSRAIQSRTSTTVKAALRDLLSAPTSTTSTGRKARKRGASPPRITPKPAPAVARTPAPAPDTAVDEATLRAVKAAIASVADGASKADVLAATGLTDGEWNKAIAALLDRGDVTRTGQKRGTRYHTLHSDERAE